jgi:hypothetical protein
MQGLLNNSLISNASIFGPGTKRWATGTLTSAGTTFDITGLGFTPTVVVVDGWSATYTWILSVALKDGFLYNPAITNLGVTINPADTPDQQELSGTPTFGVDSVTGIACKASGIALRWIAYE